MRTYPAWLDAIACASRLEKTFLYEEVFGGSYFDEGVALPKKPGSHAKLNIIDVGANIGLFALYCLEHTKGHVGRIISLEPVQETYDLLTRNLDIVYQHHQNQDGERLTMDVIPLRLGMTEKRRETSDEFYVFPRALGWSGRVEGVDTRNISRDLRQFVDNALEDASEGLAIPSAVRSIAVWLKHYLPWFYTLIVVVATKLLMLGAKRVRCPTSTLSEVIKKYIPPGERVSILKVDVEGGELKVLKGVQKAHWKRVDQLVLECTIENLPGVLELLERDTPFENIVAKQTDDLQGTSLWMVYCSR
jgi:hypothetical protein